MGETVTMTVIDASHPATSGLKGQKLRGAYFGASWRPLEGSHPRTLATLEDGTAAMVANTFGRGETLLIGSFLGLGTHPTVNANDQTLIRNLVEWAKVKPALRIDTEGGLGVEAIVRRTENGPILFLLNPTTQSREFSVGLESKGDGDIDAREFISGKTQRLPVRAGKISFRQTLGAQSVAVWDLNKGAVQQ